MNEFIKAISFIANEVPVGFSRRNEFVIRLNNIYEDMPYMTHESLHNRWLELEHLITEFIPLSNDSWAVNIYQMLYNVL